MNRQEKLRIIDSQKWHELKKQLKIMGSLRLMKKNYRFHLKDLKVKKLDIIIKIFHIKDKHFI